MKTKQQKQNLISDIDLDFYVDSIICLQIIDDLQEKRKENNLAKYFLDLCLNQDLIEIFSKHFKNYQQTKTKITKLITKKDEKRIEQLIENDAFEDDFLENYTAIYLLIDDLIDANIN